MNNNPMSVATQELNAQKLTLLLDVMRSLASELDLNTLLQLIMKKTTEVMDADRSTLFLVDYRTNELWSKVAQGAGISEIRFPIGIGIAGHVATTGETVNIPEAYEDPRFNKEIDKKTGYRTKTILCMPIRDENGIIIGVTQVLNKRDSIFTKDDEDLLGAFSAQTSIAIKNARLFEEVLYMKNYNESILSSIATGVITTDAHKRVIMVNPAAQRIFRLSCETTVGKLTEEIFYGKENETLRQLIDTAATSGESQAAYELKFSINPEEIININTSVLPLKDRTGQGLGFVLVVQDITQEQRLMSTLCRYVTREIAEQVLHDRSKLRLGGVRQKVTILFSDIRNFTGMSEQFEAEQIVTLLNDYFSRMINAVFKYQGTLDKFIGDAIMAVFGAPIARADDPIRAVEAAIEMRRELKKFNEERRRQGKPAIETGIGLCDGEVVSGNIGSEQRMDYTVIGDAVNLASRLEGLSKNFDAKILFNEAVYQTVKDRVPCVELGSESVRGKAEKVKIYGIIDHDIL
ncbi:MAG: adenylate/guanylate cyclase domain-containing protein [Acidobacteriota bacterium]